MHQTPHGLGRQRAAINGESVDPPRREDQAREDPRLVGGVAGPGGSHNRPSTQGPHEVRPQSSNYFWRDIHEKDSTSSSGRGSKQ